MNEFLMDFSKIFMKTFIEILALATVIYLFLMAGDAIAVESIAAAPIPESASTMLSGLAMIGIAAILRKKYQQINIEKL